MTQIRQFVVREVSVGVKLGIGASCVGGVGVAIEIREAKHLAVTILVLSWFDFALRIVAKSAK